MKNIITILLSGLLLIACSDTKTVVSSHTKYGPIGTYETHNWLYGKADIDSTLFGHTQSTDLDTGFSNLAQMVPALAGAIYYGKLQLSKEITTQMHDAGLTRIQIATIESELQKSLATSGYESTLNLAKAGVFTPVPFNR